MNKATQNKVKMPILIIEDDIAQLKSLAHIMSVENLEPICCRLGKEALTVCREQKVNVAILDLHLPDMDGLELLRRLKKQNHDIKVIIHTGYASLDTAMAALNEEAFAYVTKTGRIEELIAHVHRACHLHLAYHNKTLEKEVKVRSEALSRANGHLKHEIGHRREVEQALRESEERYRRLVELSFDAIIIYSAAKFVYVNERAIQLFDDVSSPEELIDQSVLDFIHPDDREKVQKWLHETEEKGKEIPLIEEVLTRPDGTSFYVEMAALPITYQGRPAVQVVIRDITKRKDLEEQLRRSQRIEAVGRLAGGIAHDFNNLLTLIIGYSEILLHRQSSRKDPLRKYLEEVYEAGERAALLTRQLLAFSRNQVLKLEVLNLNHIVADVETMLRRLIGEDIEVDIELSQDLGLIKADPGQIEQVLMNLVVNARDAMPQGGKLTITTTNVELEAAGIDRPADLSPGAYVMLVTSDSGIGMDQKTQGHIFEPFFTTKEAGKGTGLGLSTVHGIITQSNGHILVESQPGHGTTFRIYLPRVKEAINTVSVEPSLQPLGNSSETILLVEDEQAVRELARRVLHRDGYKVLVAGQGSDAIEICQQYQGPIHLLLTDVVMPGGISGRQVAERLTSLRPEMKVLYMSGYTDDVIIHHGISDTLGMALLEKPFSANTLTGRIRDVLNNV